MARKPHQDQPNDYESPAETRLASKKPDDSDNDGDIDSLGIGSITVADLAKILDDDSPTDEMPIVQEDDTFV